MNRKERSTSLYGMCIPKVASNLLRSTTYLHQGALSLDMVLASRLSIDLVSRMSKGMLQSRNDSEGVIAAIIPATHQVVVTSTRGVYSWTNAGVAELFRSGSDGIVAATKASDDKDLIAIADCQVVILHDVKKGMHQSYRLKGADVSPLPQSREPTITDGKMVRADSGF